MKSQTASIIEKITELEEQLEVEFAKRRAKLRFGLERGRIVFEEEITRRHKELRINLVRYMLAARPLTIITSPIIYSMIIPLVLLDLFVSVYQLICFPVYGISKVERSDHLIFDRYHLGYLNIIEKLNCAYCSYANGLISYSREIAARTEQYWCPIKHAKRVIGAHSKYNNFLDYGDADSYSTELVKMRQDLKNKNPDKA